MGSMNIIQADVVSWLNQNRWLVQNGYMPKFMAGLADPPYFLSEIAKRFGPGQRTAVPAKDGSFNRLSKGFQGLEWDSFEDVWGYQAWVTSWAEPLLDFMYPGALFAFFGGERTYHRLASGLEDAGWEIAHVLVYMYATGFPKSGKAKPQGWDGYRTDLSPAYEPIVIARAPRGNLTYNQCAEQFGTAHFNIPGIELEAPDKIPVMDYRNGAERVSYSGSGANGSRSGEYKATRYPNNIILGHHEDCAETCHPDCLVAEFAAVKTNGSGKVDGDEPSEPAPYDGRWARSPSSGSDAGGLERYFYSTKAAAFEKVCGLPQRTDHPTLKSISLNERICRSILPSPAIGERRLLNLFSGVGSEYIGARLAGWESITGIEREAHYVEQARQRIAWWSQYKTYEQAESANRGEKEDRKLRDAGQLGLFDRT